VKKGFSVSSIIDAEGGVYSSCNTQMKGVDIRSFVDNGEGVCMACKCVTGRTCIYAVL